MNTVPRGGSSRRGRRPCRPSILYLVVLVTACGGAATATPASSPTATGSDPAGSPAPKPPRWPGTAVLAVIKLAGADGEIAKAGKDFMTAANSNDLRLMWGAADGLIPVVQDLVSSVDPLERFNKTAELAGYLRKAYPLLIEGATLLRDSITAGDATGVEEGSRKLAEGLNAYAPARAILSDLVTEALLQQRILNL
ncbi:MAG: hypothetical protein HYX54_10640 [Chloroflexi bacterium]|nr:hypothetical protein [Chloroflexota bacterium]